jgi:membrane glycosyltransferase
MNALVRRPDAISPGLGARGAHIPDLPSEAPMTMAAQSLTESEVSAQPLPGSRSAVRLGGLIAATAIGTLVALTPVCRLLATDSFGPLDLLIVALVALLFGWTAFSFLSAVAGFVVSVGPRTCDLGLGVDDPTPELNSRTAILAPVYNEAPQPVFARLQAICESVTTAGSAAHFDLFVLSDTTDSAIRATEYAYYTRLKRRLGGGVRVYYRHRSQNLARKAGNIADWVRRFGGAYEHMVVLDADSLMEGETLTRLAGAMQANPDVGLIQTAPTIVNRHTLFARTEQFASRLYGPMLARGVAWWSGSEGNYWGHNAIIRVRAFAEQAGLPTLEGRKPFGGDILSHDFVEAALLRRAGWRVCMAGQLGGSYEESPPTLAALLARDRRWCQGNLQHVKVLRAKGLHWISRFHLLRGVSAYVVAPLWLALLFSAAMLPLHPQWGMWPGASVPAGVEVDRFDLAAVSLVSIVSIGLLIGPKILAYIQMLLTPHERIRFGGSRMAFANLVIETLLSTLVAPLIMLSHSRSLVDVLAGRDSGWAAQARDETDTTPRQAMRLHAVDTAVGALFAAAAMASSPMAFLMMAPVIVGLLLAIPLAVMFANAQVGHAARRAGVLLAPEETHPPQILARANALCGAWPKH